MLLELRTARARRFDDYAMLCHISGAGSLIGSYRDQPIWEQVIDEFGRVFDYLGLAPCRRDGSVDVDALGPGEFVLPPGLLYLCAETRAKAAARQGAGEVSLV